jgi:hypothetical protein
MKPVYVDHPVFAVPSDLFEKDLRQFYSMEYK